MIWAKTIAIQGFGTGGRLCSPNLRFWRPALSIELHPYIKHHHKMMLCPAYTGLLWSHREESNPQPADYKTAALPVELRWHFCADPLRLSHPGLGGDIMTSHSEGSFQRDSAALIAWLCVRLSRMGAIPNIGGFRLYTLRRAQPLYKCRHTWALTGRHFTRSRPAMATGRPLVILLVRFAAQIHQYSVFPQSAPCTLEQLFAGAGPKAIPAMFPRLPPIPELWGGFARGVI